MDETLKDEMYKICSMLDSPDPEIQCAAAKIIGELRPKENEAYKALGAALTSKNHLLKLFVLEAFRKNARHDCVPYLIPLLEDSDQVKASVVTTLLSFGPGMVKTFQRAFDSGSVAVKKAMAEIILRLRIKASVDFALHAIRHEDAEVVQHICGLLAEEVERLRPVDRAHLLEGTKKLLSSRSIVKDRNVAVAGIRILGMLTDPETRNFLARFAGPEFDVQVRVQALHALATLEFPEKGIVEFIRHLLPMLQETDFTHVVSNVVNVLGKLAIPAAFVDPLLRLLDSPRSEVRTLAIRALGTFPVEKAARALVDCLDDGDFRIQEEARRALVTSPAALRPLVKAIEEAQTDERRWALANLVVSHASQITPDILNQFHKGLLEAVEEDAPTRAVYLHILRRVDPDGLAERVRTRTRPMRVAKRLPQALRFLELLDGMQGIDPRARYDLALARLAGSPKGLARVERETDAALPLFRDLIHEEGFDLLKSLKADRKLVTAEDYFYLGFHFSERLEAERNFGSEVLRFVAAEFKGKKISRSAKNKMKIEGIDIQPAATKG